MRRLFAEKFFAYSEKNKDSYASMQYHRYTKLMKFILVGGTSAATSVVVLYALTHYAHVWYLLSSVISFFFAFFVSFFLQKFWTFQERSFSNIDKQLFRYSVIILCNLMLNTAALYLFVEFYHMHYVVAQLVAGGLISVVSYVCYQRYIFIARHPDSPPVARVH